MCAKKKRTETCMYKLEGKQTGKKRRREQIGLIEREEIHETKKKQELELQSRETRGKKQKLQTKAKGKGK
jgi:hypothetical protein